MNSHILFSCYIDSQIMHRHTDYIRSCTSDHIETTDATDDEDFLLASTETESSEPRLFTLIQ